MTVASALNVADVADKIAGAAASGAVAPGAMITAACLAHGTNEIVIAAAARGVSRAIYARRAMVSARAAAWVIHRANGKEERALVE